MGNPTPPRDRIYFVPSVNSGRGKVGGLLQAEIQFIEVGGRRDRGGSRKPYFVFAYEVNINAHDTQVDLNSEYQKYCTVERLIDPKGCQKLLNGYHTAVATEIATESVLVILFYVIIPIGILTVGIGRALRDKERAEYSE